LKKDLALAPKNLNPNAIKAVAETGALTAADSGELTPAKIYRRLPRTALYARDLKQNCMEKTDHEQVQYP
jgi:hypothetical protein